MPVLLGISVVPQNPACLFGCVAFNIRGCTVMVHAFSMGPSDCFFRVLPHWNVTPLVQGMTSQPVTLYRHMANLWVFSVNSCSVGDIILRQSSHHYSSAGHIIFRNNQVPYVLS